MFFFCFLYLFNKHTVAEVNNEKVFETNFKSKISSINFKIFQQIAITCLIFYFFFYF